MIFFNPPRTTDELKNALNNSTSLLAWWQNVRDEYTFRLLASHQTLLLDKAIDTLLNNFDNQQHETQMESLNTLYTLVLNWKHMHHAFFKGSHRYPQIEILQNWLEKHIFPDELTTDGNQLESFEKKKVDYSIKTVQRIRAATTNISLDPDFNKMNLYTWWKKNSSLSWFDYRSAATKELDKAIQWFSTHIIINRLTGLQEVMDATDAWLIERKANSARLPAILRLQKMISIEMDKLLKHKEDHLELEIDWDLTPFS